MYAYKMYVYVLRRIKVRRGSIISCWSSENVVVIYYTRFWESERERTRQRKMKRKIRKVFSSSSF